jgi:Mg2+-importing ATPase
MAPIQVLINNLLYDFSQTGITSDHVDEEYMQKPRKWNLANVRRFMMFVGPISSIFDYTTFALMLFYFQCHNLALAAPAALAERFPGGAGVAPDATYAAALFHSGWFIESLITQTLIVHIIRTRKIPFFQSCASPALLATTFVVIATGSVLPYIPKFAEFMGFVPLPFTYWIFIAGTIICYATLTHFVNAWFARRYGID